MLYLISYDISNNKRRRDIFKILKSYGIRVQYSIFELDLNKRELEIIKKDISGIIDEKQDSVMIYMICSECEKKSIKLGIEKGCHYNKSCIVI